jgi:methyl-accepting chemotaxis protein
MMDSLRRWSIGKRLTAGFGAVVTLGALAVILAITSLTQVAKSTEAMMAEPLQKERLVQEWGRNIAIAVRRTAAMAMSDEKALAAYFSQEQKASAERSAELQKQIEALVQGRADDQRLYDDIQDKRKVYLAARDQVLAARKAGDSAQAQTLFETQFSPAVGPYLSSVDAFLQAQREDIDTIAASIQASYTRSLTLLILASLGMLSLSGWVAWQLTRSITTPLRTAVRAAESVAAGQLRVDLPESLPGSRFEVDQLGVALSEMAQSLTQLVSGIRDASESINVAAGEIAQGNLDLSSRTEKQAANLEETSASMHELTDAVKHNAEALHEAQRQAAESSQQARQGGSSVAEVSQSMQGIESSARQISQITGVIDGIAFQTNILALNAAVEAARAGEAGRGFAVVAGEVRTLAQRAGEAAKEIRQLIEQSVNEVSSGAERVARTQRTMDTIVNSIGKVAELTQSVARSSDEQRRGIEEVNAALQQIDSITQQNAALVEEASAAAASLSEQTQKLQRDVERFELP